MVRWVHATRKHEEAEQRCAAEQQRVNEYRKQYEAAKAALNAAELQKRVRAKELRNAQRAAEGDSDASSTTSSDSDEPAGAFVIPGPDVFVAYGQDAGEQSSAGMRLADWTGNPPLVVQRRT